MRRVVQLVASVIAFAVVGGGAAQAYSFGPITVRYEGVDRGAGKGQFSAVATQVKLVPTVRDLERDGWETYIEAVARDAKVQSGRRGDGKSTWVTLATRTAWASSSLSGASTTVKVCIDRPWSGDPCKAAPSRGW